MYTTLRLTRREAVDDDNPPPMLCMRCGAKATHCKKHQFIWAPPHLRMMGWIGWLFSKYMTVNVPLCDQHKLHFWKPLIVFGIGFATIVLLMILIIPVSILGAASLGPAGGFAGVAIFALIFVAFIGMFAALIWAAFTTLRALEITDRDITLTGVSETYARAFETQRKGGKVRPRRDLEEEPLPRTSGRAAVPANTRGIQMSPGAQRMLGGAGRDPDDDDDLDDEPPRPGLHKKKTPVLMIVLILLGVFGALGLAVCGGFILVAYSAARAIPTGPIVVGPDGGRFVLPPQEPRNLDEAVAALNNNDSGQRRVGADWLKKARPDPARQGEVAGLLVGLLDDNDIGVRSAATEALFTWATKDNVPALIQLVDDNRPNHAWDHKKRAMDTLGRLKDPRAAAVLAGRLGNFFEHDHARRALEAIGPAAEKEVLKQMNDRENLARTHSRNLLRGYRTTDAVMLQQSLDDLKDNDAQRRRNAAEWIVAANVPAAQQAAVAKAVEPLVNDRDVRDQAAKVLAKWATKDNVPALVRCLSSDSREVKNAATDALVRLKDERAAEPLAKRLTEHFERESVRKALEDLGPIAEKAVLKYYNHSDHWAREAARKIVAEYGTKDDVILTQSVDDLTAKDKNTRKGAAEWLASAALVKERQAEVATALDGLLTDSDNQVVEAGLKALKVWVTKGNAASLIERVNDKDGRATFTRNLALELLGKTKDEKAVEAIAPHLGHGFHHDAAKKALIEIGSGEKTLHKYLAHPEPLVRRGVCEVLGAIGTKDSVKVLQSSVLADAAAAREAAKAIQAINERTKKP